MIVNDKHYTSLEEIYDGFLNLITDDMYLEWEVEETYEDLNTIFLSAIPNFEFPKFNLYGFIKKGEILDEETSTLAPQDMYPFELTLEEQRIITHLMLIDWLSRQIATIDVIRQNYSSRDFEMTSQANHLDKLIKLQTHYEDKVNHYQKLYSRRNLFDGLYTPNYSWTGGKRNAH